MREIEQTDLKYLWLDYNKGTSIPFAPLLDKDSFRTAAHQFFAAFQTAHIMFAPAMRDLPVGVIVGKIEEHKLFPHAFWFNWATPRNKLEAINHYLIEARQSFNVVITVGDGDNAPYNRFAKYKLLRSIGKAEDWYQDGPAYLYQTVK